MKKIKEFLFTVFISLCLMSPMYLIVFLSLDAAEDDPDWWRFWKRRKELKEKKEETNDDLEEWVEDLD